MKTILIADDEELLRSLIETTLEAPDVRILHAGDGESALELARRERPDLLLLDWIMPRKSGLEVARVLRGDPSTTAIAIVMLTGKTSEQDRQQGLALGLQAYLIKPFSPLELLRCVQEALGPEKEKVADGNAGTPTRRAATA